MNFLGEGFEGFFVTIFITILVTIFITGILLRKRAPESLLNRHANKEWLSTIKLYTSALQFFPGREGKEDKEERSSIDRRNAVCFREC